MTLSHYTKGLSAVCDCGISRSYSHTILEFSQNFMKIKPSRNDKIILSYTDTGKSCLVSNFLNVTNMSFHTIWE